ncbi:MAG: transcriptional regulator [Hyphomicrobium sp. SCN 65-11]|nr:MAG: transcriptional regulator [Hyphomicrobium sp. SCN 65-11]
MGASVGGGVEKPVETHDVTASGTAGGLDVRLLGPISIRRGGVALALPSSRKVRALFAYLALAPHPVSRSRLCELLWDVPNDPRGELRWCLSKLRRLIDTPDRRRVETNGDTIRLDLGDCFVDVIEIASATQTGVEALDAPRLSVLSAMFAGDLLDGLEMDRNPHFNTWLAAERRRFRARHTAVLEHLAKRASEEEALGHLEKWLELAPFDQSVHELMLRALVRRGRIPDAETHLATTVQLFEAEGLDATPLRHAWRAARTLPIATPTTTAAPISVLQTLVPREPEAAPEPSAISPQAPRRASVAVMPFADRTRDRGAFAAGLVHDVITRLAKLRSLFVIAPGTVFALHERRLDPEAAGRALNVDYIVTGTLQIEGPNITVAVELSETRTARIVWSDVFSRKLDDIFLAFEEIGNRIVASIASEVESAERNRAILKPPNSLDAWEAHHRGLWHMYRFNKADNDQARHFFQMAVRLDPTFARAYAGLSFTHWQNAFQGWAPRELETNLAFDAAGRSLMADDRDPAAHWAMGRALWLRNQHGQSVGELETAVDLSPNFAAGHYALAFVRSQAGDPRAAIDASDHSRHLSPFDPLLFAMLGARTMALVRLQDFESAADWGAKAASRPNAHPHVLAIGAYSQALAGRMEDAQIYAASIRRALPDYSVEDFFRAFRFDETGMELFRKGAKRLGMA